ncbi:multiprotein-bridging factor 1c [Phalaenopsis equestris]|uniref:multiprotein-bridging factor 1c n=1 Tax=Phalaenopsis equestris TaxID=78828 RepID=UPI0009E2B990|nr:multiprotein-bridging factor 1c [Phalaenopsis equestris]
MPIRLAGNITQDWDPVVLSKRKPKGADLKDPKAVNNAIRSGAAVETVKKFDAGSNKKGASAASQPAINARKLDELTEPSALDRVPADIRLAIQKARLEKKMSQAELAKQINERAQVVQDYESGKAVPKPALLAKMERVLGVKLRGKAK